MHYVALKSLELNIHKVACIWRSEEFSIGVLDRFGVTFYTYGLAVAPDRRETHNLFRLKKEHREGERPHLFGNV